ncbi:MAG: bifunctional folylpolyglutamate synthase/dihydrofolate synthase [Clostridia bacterium]|nr:bifunctional folylpolyglutamate synthase/dihydrofolate synthase [Clostridia bacterium]
MQNDKFKTYANSFQAIARLRLESIECLLNYLGNPQNDLRFIHVAGTNGKGSVCNFLQSIFTSAGYRTGKYTSPNLISVCERISIDGELISEPDMGNLLKTVEQGVRQVVAKLGDSPTQFEIWTAAAFLYFKEKNCDIVVLETGLGGSRDATNIIPCPLASVITRLDLDHTEYLGDTIEKIAAEKAGIIKSPQEGQTGLCVTAKQDVEALKVLTEACKSRSNKLVVTNPPNLKGFEDFRERFDYTSADANVTIRDIECGLCGIYQPENGALAIEVALQLGIDQEHIIKGIKSAINPARFEVIREKDPVVIYDGAHNKNGISALCACLKRYFPRWHGGTFVMGFMGDKDMDAAFEELKSSGLTEKSRIFAVQVKDNPRAATAQQICDRAKERGIEAIPFDSIGEAYQKALALSFPVIVCGSLYLYKDFYEII